MRVPLLIITRGLPGCGKTTWARQYVALASDLTVRINRDDLRMMMFAKRFGVDEDAVTRVQYAAVNAALDARIDVVCDDTNLPEKDARALLNLAHRRGFRSRVQDFRHVPIDTCLRQNASPERREAGAVVPMIAILGMAERYGLPTVA